jgi:uncharacterized protein YggE
MKAVQAIVSLVLVSLAVSAANAAPGSRNGRVIERVVRLTAQGVVKARPDTALIGLAVATQADTAQAVLEQNRAAMGKVIAELTKAGVAEDDVQTVDFSMHPRYQRSKDGVTATIIGYRVVNSARVTARNLSRLGQVLDKVMATGASQIDRIEFIISDHAKLLDEARKQAMANARRKVALYAQAAGVEVGEVISIDEQIITRPNRLVRPTPKDSAFGDSPIRPDDDDAKVEVSVVWELIDKKP